MGVWRGAAASVLILAASAPARAQAPVRGPVPPVAVDVRGFSSGVGQDPVVAHDLGIAANRLPSRALGFEFGVTGYPVRKARHALGLGLEFLKGGGHFQQTDASGGDVGERVETALRGYGGFVSINFGNEGGWSYAGAGLSRLQFETFLGDTAPEPVPRGHNTITFGAGARWFGQRHFGFAFDLRFYLTKPLPDRPPYPGRERKRLLILSAGLSIK